MPISYDTKAQEWKITDPTPEEVQSLLYIGKHIVVEGLAGQYTNERYKTWLMHRDINEMFRA